MPRVSEPITHRDDDDGGNDAGDTLVDCADASHRIPIAVLGAVTGSAAAAAVMIAVSTTAPRRALGACGVMRATDRQTHTERRGCVYRHALHPHTREW